MGTSSSYKGSTGKVGRALRDGVGQWADGQSAGQKSRIPEGVVAQALKIPVFSRRSSGGGGGGAGGGTGRKQSAPRRDARAYAATASRAANLARAFREGDREALTKAGLDFDSLSALPTRAEMVRAILDVVCEAQTSSDIPAEEQRDIAHHLLEWMLDTDVNPSTPDAAATAEHAIGVMIAEIFISESDEFTSTGSVSREDFIDEVYDASHQLAARANLSEAGASPDAIDSAIERGLHSLRRIFKDGAE
ncbi:hypothetical protein JOD63_000387 [Microbacterium terrae]|uniref:Uncharacterized protein n=1 Tax=Microbacterium terrae TaxID=69369 RepID=A0A0M2GVN6_9MICO|nr:hypothetical protein [Microbacterium terrae]KJL37587.1 hypothetical protein RS81_03344 [Microbacterium terrae]MBP1076419.1 hypothetical protein [Microbacterium terrae]GLJ97247.1 hypothetical protein GCM10017594_04440 [Microbacterium terrae]